MRDITFQYQKGAIKTNMKVQIYHKNISFQYQKGAIKTIMVLKIR